jgi:Rrf2 family protein
VNFSKRGEYALRVLLDLAMASILGEPLVSLNALAEAQRIPVPFLEQILLNLRQGGFLRATRGKHGGYTLAKPASDLLVGELIRFLEGPLAPIACASHSAYQACSCPDEKHCGIRLLMIEARDALASVFDSLTLQQMAERTLAGMQAEGITPPLLSLLKTPAARSKRKRSGDDPEYVI